VAGDRKRIRKKNEKEKESKGGFCRNFHSCILRYLCVVVCDELMVAHSRAVSRKALESPWVDAAIVCTFDL